MPKIIEYAKLSAHVYSPKKSLMGHHPGEQSSIDRTSIEWLKKKDKSSRWYAVSDVNPRMRPSDAFYAQLYIKVVDQIPKYAVIAYRGSYNLPNYLADAVSWISDVMGDGANVIAPPYFTAKAHRFYRDSVAYIQHYLPTIRRCHLSITGHSLGGALAQLMLARYLLPSRAITFNPPGIGEMMTVRPEAAHRIFSVNSIYGLINKAGVQVGNVYQIHVAEKEAEAKTLFEKFNRKLYNASLSLYRLENSSPIYSPFQFAIGFSTRFAAYAAAEPALANALTTHALEKECMASHMDAWRLNKKIMQLKCDATAVAKEFAAVVLAQHGITNIVKALLQKENANIAMKSIL